MIQRLSEEIINVYSDMNPWIDYIFLLNNKEEYDKAAEIVQKAYNDWFDLLDDGVYDIPIAEYIHEQLKEAGIITTLYVLSEGEKEDDYEFDYGGEEYEE